MRSSDRQLRSARDCRRTQSVPNVRANDRWHRRHGTRYIRSRENRPADRWSRKRQQRIEQARFLQAEYRRIGTQQRAKAAFAELNIGLSGRLFDAGNSGFRLLLSATFEHAQDVAGLRYLPPLNRFKIRKDAFGARFFGSRWWKRLQSLRCSVLTIALGKEWILEWNRAIVVKSRAPQHRAVRHHAGADALNFGSMTSGTSASLLRDPQIAGVDEFDVIPVFFEPLGISANRVGGAASILSKTRSRMSLTGDLLILRCPLRNTRRQRDLGIASVTVGATQAHRSSSVHGGAVHRAVAGHAATRFLLCLFD